MPTLTSPRVVILLFAVYVLLPLFTGFLFYQPDVDEIYDESRHELLDEAPVPADDEGHPEWMRPLEWKNRATGEVFTPESFIDHHRHEAFRMGLISFFYGLLACVYSAYLNQARRGTPFLRAFAVSLPVNAAIAFGVFWLVLHMSS